MTDISRQLRTETLSLRFTPQQMELFRGMIGYKGLWTMTALFERGMELLAMEQAAEGPFAPRRRPASNRPALEEGLGLPPATEDVLADFDTPEALSPEVLAPPANTVKQAKARLKEILEEQLGGGFTEEQRALMQAPKQPAKKQPAKKQPAKKRGGK